MKPFTTSILQRYGFRNVLLVNGVIGVVSILACALFTPQTPFALIAAVLFVGGLSRSMQFTCYNSIEFADVPNERMSEASALFSMFFQLAMGMSAQERTMLIVISTAVPYPFNMLSAIAPEKIASTGPVRNTGPTPSH